MSAESATAPGIDAARLSAPAPTRPFYWSVRRELWEHRSIVVAPLAVAGLVLFGFLVRIAQLPQALRTVSTLKPSEQSLVFAAPFGIAAATIAGTGLIVAFFYCLGALYNERRDRSVLFWKSLPVSNLTAVLSKAFVPLVVVPLVVLAVALAAQLVMLLAGTLALMAYGLDSSSIWTHWPFFRMAVVELYTLVVLTLWYAPIYGWLLLVSSWARSMAILWAVLPPVGLCIAERIAFDTAYLSSLLDHRLNGFVSAGFTHDLKADPLVDPLAILAPDRFLLTPGLWIGLALAAGFLAGAVWLRRNRDPI